MNLKKNVWEIKNYCQNGKNAILIDNNFEKSNIANVDSVINLIKRGISDISFANELSRNAYNTWSGQKLFYETFSDVLKEI